MKKIIYILLISMLPAAVFAEDPYFRAKSGDQAFLFSLKGLSALTAGNFDGGLGYQVYFANHWAFRFGLGIGYDKEATPKPEGFDHDYDSTSFRFDLMPAVRYNIAASGNIAAYFGIAGLVSLRNITKDGVGFGDLSISRKETSFGFGLIMGAEWFAWKNVSLSAEYQLMYKSTSGKERVESGTNSQESDIPGHASFLLGASQANFTISFYFN